MVVAPAGCVAVRAQRSGVDGRGGAPLSTRQERFWGIVFFFALTFLPFSQEIWALTGNLGRENEVFLQEIWALTGGKWGVFTARRRRKKIGVFSSSTGFLRGKTERFGSNLSNFSGREI